MKPLCILLPYLFPLTIFLCLFFILLLHCVHKSIYCFCVFLYNVFSQYFNTLIHINSIDFNNYTDSMYICYSWVFLLMDFMFSPSLSVGWIGLQNISVLWVSLEHIPRVGCWVIPGLCCRRFSLCSAKLFCHFFTIRRICFCAYPWPGPTEIVASQMGVKWWVSVILICISLITGKVMWASFCVFSGHLGFLFRELTVHFFYLFKTFWGGEVSTYWSYSS